MDEIVAHVEKHVGKVHVDVHWIKPTTEKPFHTLVTTGTSDKPMHTPKELEGGK